MFSPEAGLFRYGPHMEGAEPADLRETRCAEVEKTLSPASVGEFTTTSHKFDAVPRKARI